MSFVWLALIIAFAIVESVTYQLICIWFALGSVGGLVTSLITDNYTIQIVAALLISILALICLRPLVKKTVNSQNLKTNVEELVGKEVIITEDVCNIKSQGAGKVNGMTWTVRSTDGSDIPKDSVAVIEKVEGVKLIVKGGNE